LILVPRFFDLEARTKDLTIGGCAVVGSLILVPRFFVLAVGAEVLLLRSWFSLCWSLLECYREESE
jgi:hypothetical protein